MDQMKVDFKMVQEGTSAGSLKWSQNLQAFPGRDPQKAAKGRLGGICESMFFGSLLAVGVVWCAVADIFRGWQLLAGQKNCGVCAATLIWTWIYWQVGVASQVTHYRWPRSERGLLKGFVLV